MNTKAKSYLSAHQSAAKRELHTGRPHTLTLGQKLDNAETLTARSLIAAHQAAKCLRESTRKRDAARMSDYPLGLVAAALRAALGSAYRLELAAAEWESARSALQAVAQSIADDHRDATYALYSAPLRESGEPRNVDLGRVPAMPTDAERKRFAQCYELLAQITADGAKTAQQISTIADDLRADYLPTKRANKGKYPLNGRNALAALAWFQRRQDRDRFDSLGSHRICGIVSPTETPPRYPAPLGAPDPNGGRIPARSDAVRLDGQPSRLVRSRYGSAATRELVGHSLSQLLPAAFGRISAIARRHDDNRKVYGGLAPIVIIPGDSGKPSQRADDALLISAAKQHGDIVGARLVRRILGSDTHGGLVRTSGPPCIITGRPEYRETIHGVRVYVAPVLTFMVGGRDWDRIERKYTTRASRVVESKILLWGSYSHSSTPGDAAKPDIWHSTDTEVESGLEGLRTGSRIAPMTAEQRQQAEIRERYNQDARKKRRLIESIALRSLRRCPDIRVADSYAYGNCPAGTAQFIRKLRAETADSGVTLGSTAASGPQVARAIAKSGAHHLLGNSLFVGAIRECLVRHGSAEPQPYAIAE